MSSYDDRGPYFKFFPGDWLADADTRVMGSFARGLLIDLLCVQWREGYVIDDPEWVAGVVRVKPSEMETFERAWPDVRKKFEPDPDRPQHLRNARLARVREAFECGRAAQRAGGRKGAERRYGTSGPYPCKGCGKMFPTHQALGGHTKHCPQCKGPTPADSASRPASSLLADPSARLQQESSSPQDPVSQGNSRSPNG